MCVQTEMIEQKCTKYADYGTHELVKYQKGIFSNNCGSSSTLLNLIVPKYFKYKRVILKNICSLLKKKENTMKELIKHQTVCNIAFAIVVFALAIVTIDNLHTAIDGSMWYFSVCLI